MDALYAGRSKLRETKEWKRWKTGNLKDKRGKNTVKAQNK